MDERNMFFECEPKITKRISHKIEDKTDVEDLRQEVFIRYANGLKRHLLNFWMKNPQFVADFEKAKIEWQLKSEKYAKKK